MRPNLVGSHVAKKPSLFGTLCEHDGTYPIQIFLGATKNWNRPRMTNEELLRCGEYMYETKLECYIHSIYLINLCRPLEDHTLKKAIFTLIYDLYVGHRIGAKGVVVHCGKSLDMELSQAMKNMYVNLTNMIKYIYPNCPLLLETPAGQGTEVLTRSEDFKLFYSMFSKVQRNLLKICVDTCHVFSSGHCPLQYITDIYQLFPESLVLVHYNDSKCEKNSRKDRHEYPGRGYIGIEIMEEIRVFCQKRNIPMVVE